MITYKQALDILRRAAQSRGVLPSESAVLKDACGRVLARRAVSADALPSFDNSSMDGYAVRAAQTSHASAKNPAVLKVLGSVAAGDKPSRARSSGAYEIMTGAPIPAGLDAVVKVEDVELRGADKEILLRAPAGRGDHIRRRGRDFELGAHVCEAGTVIEARHLLAFSALGIEKVAVRRRPKVAVISTGRELAGAGAKLSPGQIRNATAAYLLAALEELGAEPSFGGVCPDDPADFRRRMEKALAGRPDIVVTTGAVSMGRHDFVTAQVRELGARVLYHKVAIRPGKPGLFARLPQGPLFFGLPGNPVSTVAGLRFFIRPILRLWLGQPEERPLRARLAEDAEKPEGLLCFYKARLSLSPRGAAVTALPGQASFQIRPLLEANAWLVLPEAGSVARAGSEVDVYMDAEPSARRSSRQAAAREACCR